MSMLHDFIHPRQVEDMEAVRVAIRSFSGDMTKMMLLMKELGTTLERVSHSFDALTSLSFTGDEVKRYVHHFAEEVVQMKEGLAFRNYNKLVHEEVLAPVEQLKTSLKLAEKAAKTEKSAFSKYKSAKHRVDKQEKTFAEKSRGLDTSKSYPNNVQARDKSLATLQKSKSDFEGLFVSLVKEVETVTATALKRYLDLNAGYMTSVVDALRRTDPTVEEAVALYRQEQYQLRQSAIKQRCSEVKAEMSASYAAQEHHRDPNAGADARTQDSLPTSKMSPTSFREHYQPPTTTVPGRPPLSNMSSPPTPPLKAAAGAAAAPSNGPPPATKVAAPVTPIAKEGTTAARENSSISSSSPPRTAVPTERPMVPERKTSLSTRNAGGDDVDEDDFGSVSQVGTAGRVPPPLYNFSRGPQSQVSSVRPHAGYVAAHNAALTNEFMSRMDTKSITASEICSPRQVSK